MREICPRPVSAQLPKGRTRSGEEGKGHLPSPPDLPNQPWPSVGWQMLQPDRPHIQADHISFGYKLILRLPWEQALKNTSNIVLKLVTLKQGLCKQFLSSGTHCREPWGDSVPQTGGRSSDVTGASSWPQDARKHLLLNWRKRGSPVRNNSSGLGRWWKLLVVLRSALPCFGSLRVFSWASHATRCAQGVAS